MRDQPFKRTFPNQTKQAFKYPTYQHYYNKNDPHASRSVRKMAPTTAPFENSPPKHAQQERPPAKKNKTNLKMELENLKNQVHKIMEKKQGILRSPIKRKLFDTDRIKNDSAEVSGQQDSMSDTHSVTSEKLFGRSSQKLQEYKQDHYDSSKYLQLENDLLKTELRNLKDKYHSKKRELTEKSQALEKKVVYLENCLFRSEESLAGEIATLKEALQAVESEKSQLKPTSDKVEESQSEKIALLQAQVETLKQKLREANETIGQKELSIQKLSEQILSQEKRLTETIKQKYELKLAQVSQNLTTKDQLIADLEQQLQEKSKEEGLIEGLKVQLQEAQTKIESAKDQFQSVNDKLEASRQEIMLLIESKAQVVKQNSELYTSLVEKDNKNTQILKQNTELLQDIVKVESKIQQLEEEKANSQVQEQCSEDDRLRQTIEEQQRELKQKQKRISELSQLLETAESRVKDIQEESFNSSRAHEDLEQQMNVLKQKLKTTLKELSESKKAQYQMQEQLEQQREKSLSLSPKVSKKLSSDSQRPNSPKQTILRKEIIKLEETVDKLSSEQEKLESQLELARKEGERQAAVVEDLRGKLKTEKSGAMQLEEHYSKIIKINDQKHEELVKKLQQEIRSIKMSPRKKRKEQNLNDSVGRQKEESVAGQSEREVRRWKLEYKLLKEKHEAFVAAHKKGKAEQGDELRSNKEAEQQLAGYRHKIKLLESQFQKYLTLLTDKQNDLVNKEIQLNKVKSQLSMVSGKQARGTKIRDERIKELQQKVDQLTKKLSQEEEYRLEVEAKIGKQGKQKELLEKMKKRSNEQDEKISRSVKDIKNKEALIAKLKKELRETMEAMEGDFESKKAEEIERALKRHAEESTEVFEIWKKKSASELELVTESQKSLAEEASRCKKEWVQKQEECGSLRDQVKQISHAYNVKCIEMIEEVERREEEIRRLQTSLDDYRDIRFSIESIYRDELQTKTEEIECLRAELKEKILAMYKTVMPKNASFDEVLKQQIEGNDKLKEEAEKRAEEIYRLRDSYTTLRSQHENLKSQSDINKLRYLSEKKNMEVAFGVEAQNLRNEISGWEKRVNALQQKIQQLLEENRKKDSFIQNFMMGKKLKAEEKDLVTAFIQEYRISMGSSDIVERLQHESRQIEQLMRYNEGLLLEVTALKQRILLYEAIDEEGVSIYDSRCSREVREMPDDSPEGSGKGQASKMRMKKTRSMAVLMEQELEQQEAREV